MPEVVVVTGASAGVGRATARVFAEQGAHMGLLARGREGLEGARKEVEAQGGKALVVPTDVADAEAVEAGYIGGNFRLTYSGGGLLGRCLETLAPFYRRLGRYYGDSGIFVRRDVYERVGGFPEIPAMEDVVFVRRMEEVGRTICLPGPMVCSPRRWEGRPLRTLALWVFMQAMFDLGASPLWLAKFYRPQALHKKSLLHKNSPFCTKSPFD